MKDSTTRRYQFRRFVHAATIGLAAWSCNPSRPNDEQEVRNANSKRSVIDQPKFEPLYRASKSIQGAIGVGLTYPDFGKLLQSFASEISIAQDRARSADEQQLVKHYADALSVFKDSATLWQKKIESGDSWDGQIFYTVISSPVSGPGTDPRLAPIVEKYRLVTQDYRKYGQHLVTISPASIQLLWAEAGKYLDAGNHQYFEER